MIATPHDWRVHRGARELVLVPAGEPSAATLTYEEGLRPLAPVRELVAAALRGRPPIEAARLGSIAPLVTAEGEHAAQVTVTGTRDGAPVQLDLGFTLLDDSYARIVAETAAPARFAGTTAAVRDLVLGDSHLLGVRPRRPLYARPAGWHALARGLMTEWYPPSYPRQRAVVTVWPALPTGGRAVSFWQAAAQPELGFADDPRQGRWPVVSEHGLAGHGVRLVRTTDTGTAVEREVVTLEDDRYLYGFRLDLVAGADGAAADACRHALARMVATTRPIPRGTGPAVDAGVLHHWVN